MYMPPLRLAAILCTTVPLLLLVVLQQPQQSAAANARVRFETSQGAFLVEVHHEWAPRGAAKFQAMVRDHFFTQTRFHHIEKVREAKRSVDL